MLSRLAKARLDADPDLAALAAPHARAGADWRGRLADFLEATKIEVVLSADQTALAPFRLWEPPVHAPTGTPSQRALLTLMESERLLVFLKARQLGLTWLVCGYAAHACVTTPGYPVLALSRGQLEANELIRRMALLYHQHSDKTLPKLVTDNTGDLAWGNGSRVISLAATKDAGRSFTAALAILDEWAFMKWPAETLKAVKPTIDAGGKLFIIASADGQGSHYHQFWEQAKAGMNGYKAIFLPWSARPDRDAGWRDRKLAESGGDVSGVLREYPVNDIEAFTHAAGLVYGVWSDGPDDGNVREEAEYVKDGGEVVWAVDDGVGGKLDPSTGQYTAASHPRVFLLAQIRHDGRICVFEEHYSVHHREDIDIKEVLALPYPEPDYAIVDKSAAALRLWLSDCDITNYGGSCPSVVEGIKILRAALAPDGAGVCRILVHPRCKHLRFEMAAYRQDEKDNPVKAFDHGPDGLRYLAWHLRYDG